MIDGKLKREDIDDEEFDGLNNSNERLKRIIELKINFIIKWKRLESEDSF